MRQVAITRRKEGENRKKSAREGNDTSAKYFVLEKYALFSYARVNILEGKMDEGG